MPGNARLFVNCSMGSLGVVSNTLAGKLAAVKNAGFDGIEMGVGGDRKVLLQIASIAKDLGLRLGGSGYLRVDDSPDPIFALAAEAGAKYLELQVDGYWQDDAWIVARTQQLMKLGEAHDLPFHLETHRGRYTQDMRRTLWLLDQLPTLSLCGDFSHYASTCELVAPWPAAWKDPLYKIANRCRMLHGRLNGGQRVQDPLDTLPPAQIDEFLGAWQHAYTAASAAGAESFTLTTELLGPHYQMLVDGQPLGDLWADSCRLREMVVARLAGPALI